MSIHRESSRRAARTNILFLTLTLLPFGCATPPKMRLAEEFSKESRATRWWVLPDPAGVYSPIVGVEWPGPNGTASQIVLCSRGVRRFSYQGARLRHSGPPLAGHDGDSDGAVVRAAVRDVCRRCCDTHVAAVEDVESLCGVAELAKWLAIHHPTEQVDPPEGLSYRQVDAELEHFPHGIFQLLEAAKAF